MVRGGRRGGLTPKAPPAAGPAVRRRPPHGAAAGVGHPSASSPTPQEAAYAAFYGSLPARGFVMARCGDGGCADPSHLYTSSSASPAPRPATGRRAGASKGPGTIPVLHAIERRRFLALIDRSAGERSCWRWAGPANMHGRWVFNVSRPDGPRRLLARRVAWAFAFGPLIRGDEILLSCAGPDCMNPAHMRRRPSAPA